MGTTVVYAGSFDPPTFGHLNIIYRAAQLFPTLVVGIGVNPGKKPAFSGEERAKMLWDCIHGMPEFKNLPGTIIIDTFGGLVVDFAREHHAKALIRGMRPTGDFDTEFAMAMTNKALAEDIETIFLATDLQYSYISSSMVKQVMLFGGDYHKLVPAPIANYVKQQLEKQ